MSCKDVGDHLHSGKRGHNVVGKRGRIDGVADLAVVDPLPDE
ncbi:hypothetical protein [Arthrobacter pigmenti]